MWYSSIGSHIVQQSNTAWILFRLIMQKWPPDLHNKGIIAG